MNRMTLLLPLFLLLPASVRAEERLLTLDEALARAADAHPSLRASRAGLDAADRKVLEARSGFLPRADVSLGYKRATLNSSVAPYLESSPLKAYMSREEASSYDNLSAGLSVTQTIWDFGRTLGSYRAAQAGVRAQAADLEATQDQLRLNVILAYIGVLATQDEVVAKAGLDTLTAK